MKEETENREKNRELAPPDDENEPRRERHPLFLCRIETSNAVFGLELDQKGIIRRAAPIATRFLGLTIHALAARLAPLRVDVLVKGKWRPVRSPLRRKIG